MYHNRNVTEAGDVPITMGIVQIWLYHKDNPNNVFMLCLVMPVVELKANFCSPLCMAPRKSKKKKAVDGLMASHFQENKVSLALPRTYVRRQIPADRDEIPRPERVQGWPRLQQISKHIPAYMDSVKWDFLSD